MTFSRLFVLCIATALVIANGVQTGQAAFRLHNSSWIFQGIDLDDIWIEAAKGKQAKVRFEKGRISGTTGCNRLSGHYEQSGNTIKISGFATTRMMCPDALMEQERAILDGLGSATRFEHDEQIIRFQTKDNGSLVFRRYFETSETPRHKPSKGIIDHSGLHTYATCQSAQGELLGFDGGQCVIDRKVYFQDGQPAISLKRCTHYYDGCNSHIVSEGKLLGGTLMACPAEQDVPGCFVGDKRLIKAVGRVVEIHDTSLDIVFGDIAESFKLDRTLHPQHIKIGDHVAISYLEGKEPWDRSLLEIQSRK